MVDFQKNDIDTIHSTRINSCHFSAGICSGESYLKSRQARESITKVALRLKHPHRDASQGALNSVHFVTSAQAAWVLSRRFSVKREIPAASSCSHSFFPVRLGKDEKEKALN